MLDVNHPLDFQHARVQRCTEPDDLNFGGWDVLLKLPDGSYTCVDEVTDLEAARDVARVLNLSVQILNGEA